MKNIVGDMYLHNCILMELDTFKELVENLTDELKTVEYEFGAYITDSEMAEELGECDERDITEILSEHFGVNVTSWHSDTDDENPCVWIIYNEGEKTGQLSMDDMKEMMNEKGMVEGIIEVDIHEFINQDLEGFLDLISERLTGSPLLNGSNYDVVGREGDSILLKVTGDASLILESE